MAMEYLTAWHFGVVSFAGLLLAAMLLIRTRL